MRKILLIIFLLMLVWGCSEDHTPVPVNTDYDYFVSATLLGESTLSSLKTAATIYGASDISDLLKFPVTTYKIEYKTTYKGESINASGLVYIPKGLTEAAPLLSFQHGTTFIKDDAPSIANSFTGMEFYASTGYVSILPDFIGYGESDQLFHPYYDKDYSASSVVDMIKAVIEFLPGKKINTTNELFLTGYSEGGYITMATAHAIEQENTLPEISLMAIAAGAGGYDLNEMLNGLITSPNYPYPGYLAFLMLAYNETYEWELPTTHFFAESYASALDLYFDGKHSGDFINSQLTTNLEELFNNDFYNNLKSDGETEFKNSLELNTIKGWNSVAPIRLYHGSNDEIIPFNNSLVTFQHFHDAGNEEIELFSIVGGTHSSSFLPMAKDVLLWFETFR